MAKPNIPNQKNKYSGLNKRLAGYVALVRQIYDALNLEAAKMAHSVKYNGKGNEFHFKDYPELRDRVKKLQSSFISNLSSVIYSGTSNEWKNSNLVQDLIADKVLKAYGAISKGVEYKQYYQVNSDALRAFQGRKDRGLNLSQKIWNQSENYKEELEYAISTAIQKGTSAVTLSKQISKYLEDFKLLQKDYKAMYGKSVECHDCEYRSIRLARSEINLAYRTAEQKRWEQMDFVVGQEIKISNNHTCNGVPFTDICDDLKGKYPKDFKFTGWHPMCRCYVIPILKSEDEFWSDDDVKSKNKIEDTPYKFKEWVSDNSERIKAGKSKGTLPYFIRENSAYIKSNDLDYAIKDVINMAEYVKNEVQGLAESIAAKHGAIVTPINIKSYESIKRKVKGEGSTPYKLKDIVRTTIIADKEKIKDVLNDLSSSDIFLKLKVQLPEDYMGYTGNIVNIKTVNGLVGEIQVNTASMIYAKEMPDNAKKILGEKLWAEIESTYKVEGGLGHKLYEEIRVLDVLDDYKKYAELVEKSRKYYSVFQY